jgi:hypothetical protein
MSCPYDIAYYEGYLVVFSSDFDYTRKRFAGSAQDKNDG